jgi:hypothetical protein
MKRFTIPMLFCLLVAFSCKQNKPQPDIQPAAAQQPIVAAPAVPLVDTVLVKIQQIVDEELKARNLHFQAKEKQAKNDTTSTYSYAFEKDNYTTFLFIVTVFDSERLAQQEIADLNAAWEEVKSESFVMWTFLRINNKVYQFHSTANIEHIEGKIIRRIKKEWNIKEEDTAVS